MYNGSRDLVNKYTDAAILTNGDHYLKQCAKPITAVATRLAEVAAQLPVHEPGWSDLDRAVRGR
ncbi:hypothetical protein ACFOJ6_13115 [Gordonia humi]